jgi:hypothetical protein
VFHTVLVDLEGTVVDMGSWVKVDGCTPKRNPSSS